MRVACALFWWLPIWMLGLSAGCERETSRTIAVVHLFGAGAGANLSSGLGSRVLVRLSLDGVPNGAAQEFPPEQTEVNFQLPDSANGLLAVEVQLLDCHACELASGRGTATLAGRGRYDISPEFRRSSPPACQSGVLKFERYRFTPVLLSTGPRAGQVLLAAGEDQALAPAPRFEIYDSQAGTSASSVENLRGRSQVGTAVLKDGRVLLVGGESFAHEVSALVEMFDPVREELTLVAPLLSPRSQHATVALADGRVLVVGGGSATQELTSTEIYHAPSNTWTSLDSDAFGRSGLSATLMPDGRVLVAGGRERQTGLYALTAELFDPAAPAGHQWQSAGTLSGGRAGHVAVPLPGGKVLLLGGSGASGVREDGELYDPSISGNPWSPAGVPIAALHQASATALADGRVLVAGGLDDASASSTQLYDPQSNSFSAGPRLALPRSQHAALALPSGAVLLLGGTSVAAPDSGGAGFVAATEQLFPHGCGSQM